MRRRGLESGWKKLKCFKKKLAKGGNLQLVKNVFQDDGDDEDGDELGGYSDDVSIVLSMRVVRIENVSAVCTICIR